MKFFKLEVKILQGSTLSLSRFCTLALFPGPTGLCSLAALRHSPYHSSPSTTYWVPAICHQPDRCLIYFVFHVYLNYANYVYYIKEIKELDRVGNSGVWRQSLSPGLIPQLVFFPKPQASWDAIPNHLLTKFIGILCFRLNLTSSTQSIF